MTNSLWDEQSPYGDVVTETDGSGAVQASEVLGGELLAQVQGSGAITRAARLGHAARGAGGSDAPCDAVRSGR